MAYNLSLSANATGYLNFIQTINENILNNYLGVMMITVVFSIMTISFLASGFDPKRSLIGTSFVCFILSGLLMLVDLLPIEAVVIFALIFGVVMAWSALQT